MKNLQTSYIFNYLGNSFEKWHNRLAAINSGQKMAVLWGISPLGGNDKGAGMVCVCKPELLLLTWVRSPWFDTDTPIHAHTNTITPTISGTQQTNRKNLSTFSFKILHIKHFAKMWIGPVHCREEIFFGNPSHDDQDNSRETRERGDFASRGQRDRPGAIFFCNQISSWIEGDNKDTFFPSWFWFRRCESSWFQFEVRTNKRCSARVSRGSSVRPPTDERKTIKNWENFIKHKFDRSRKLPQSVWMEKECWDINEILTPTIYQILGPPYLIKTTPSVKDYK